MTLVKTHSPFAKPFDGLMNELFNELPTNFGKVLREDVLHFPPVNITENETGFTVNLSAPGFEKTDFSIKLEANLLTISAEKKVENTETTEKTIRKEFSLKSFKRSFNVDDKIDATAIAAKYENGILAVILPKKEEVKAAAKEITIA
jgi:HSP20 family protein